MKDIFDYLHEQDEDLDHLPRVELLESEKQDALKYIRMREKKSADEDCICEQANAGAEERNPKTMRRKAQEEVRLLLYLLQLWRLAERLTRRYAGTADWKKECRSRRSSRTSWQRRISLRRWGSPLPMPESLYRWTNALWIIILLTCRSM